VSVVGKGPTLTRYAVTVPSGTKVSRITKLAEDIALALGVPAVWFTQPIAPWTLGLDVPNTVRQTVKFESVAKFGSSYRVPLYLGCDVTGKKIVVDLVDLPHLLVAGRTGSGKSVCLHGIIQSLHKHDSAGLVLIDPKQVEFQQYRDSRLLKTAPITDVENADACLFALLRQMEQTFSRLAEVGAKDLDEFYRRTGTVLKRTVVVVDELADLLMTGSPTIERSLIRLAQKGRAAGFHLVLATQRPTVDVVTGLLKANVPARLCFQVASRLESRVVLDESGAESLLGKGDFLLSTGSEQIRGQAALAT
jgi:S-DNA-T family DNA segregation ATPase FtsK/SpoIIIE